MKTTVRRISISLVTIVAASMIGCDGAPGADQAKASDGQTETSYRHGASHYYYHGGSAYRSPGQSGDGASSAVGESDSGRSGSSKGGTSRGGFGGTGSGRTIFS